jgi:hypothetical protein
VGLLFRQQDVDAEEVHGQHGVDDLEVLAIHEGAEAFVGFDQAPGLPLRDAGEFGLEDIEELDLVFEEARRAPAG